LDVVALNNLQNDGLRKAFRINLFFSKSNRITQLLDGDKTH